MNIDRSMRDPLVPVKMCVAARLVDVWRRLDWRLDWSLAGATRPATGALDRFGIGVYGMGNSAAE